MITLRNLPRLAVALLAGSMAVTVFPSHAADAPAPTGNAAPDASAPPKPPPPAQTEPKSAALAPFAWLAGCWQGTVNRRQFREVWLPLRGSVMVGVSQTVGRAETTEYQYLRLEPRADGIHYIATTPGQADTTFRFAGQEKDRNDDVFSFVNPESEFPRRISYRRGSMGWLYAEVEGILAGAERKVVYPMRHIDCATDAIVER